MVAPVHLSNALATRPELASEIAFLIADYAALEILLFEAFVAVSLAPAHDAFSTFFGFRSINNKTKLLIDAAETLPPPFQRAVRRLVRRMKGAAERRTEIAHVHFMDVGKGPMRLHLAGQHVNVTPLTEDFLKRTADQYRTLGTDLIAFVSALTAGRSAHMIARSEAATLGLHEQLRRPPTPQEFRSQLSAAEIADADARLGLTEFLASKPIVLRMRNRDLPNGYRWASVVVRFP